MKILMTADTVGGIWTYSLELIQALAEHGVEVELATMGALPTPEQRTQLDDIKNVRLHSSEFKLEWMEDPWEDVECAGKWLLRLEEKLQPDIVHLNGYTHGALPWKSPVLSVGHSCVLSWWQAVKGEPAPQEWYRYRQEVSRGLRAARLVIAPSTAMLHSLERYYGPFNRTDVIYNSRNPHLFQSGIKEPFIFTAGRVWDNAKNITALEKAAPELQWPVFVAGDNEHPDGGIRNHENIHYLGRLAPQALPFWFAKASIYALPARYEPFGLSALEAALAGCALVLGDIPSLREIWGDAAIFVPPDDTHALTESLNLLSANDSFRTDMARKAHTRALEYSPERMAEGYLNTYKSLIEERPAWIVEQKPWEESIDKPLPTETQSPLRIVMFYHSLVSDWNHGNAHFLRGIVSELLARGHDVRVFEPRDSWSRKNLIIHEGEEPLRLFCSAYPHLKSTQYCFDSLDIGLALDEADLVLVHEWNDHSLVRCLGNHHKRFGGYTLLFHDTHHRSVTNPESMAAYDLSGYDGVLAFGQIIRDIYLSKGWTDHAWTWHEAADTRIFQPLDNDQPEGDLIWIGNWGDDERTAELQEFLTDPVKQLGLKARVHGVRYPDAGRKALQNAGINYAGWLPNYKVPEAFASHKVTVHIPRRPYVEALPGIPTIRVFEALACGIPLVSAPWSDTERLFTPGEDYLIARNGTEMKELLKAVLADESMARELSLRGRNTILSRHTCAHRVDELLNIFNSINRKGSNRLSAVRASASGGSILTSVRRSSP